MSSCKWCTLFRRSTVPGEHRSAIPSGHRSAGPTQGWTIDMWQLWGDHGLSQECSAGSGQEDTRQSDEAGNSETDMFEVALGWVSDSLPGCADCRILILTSSEQYFLRSW